MLRRYGASCSAKLARLAAVVGLVADGADEQLAAERFICWVEAPNHSFGLPAGFSQIRDIPLMATHAAKESNPLYPVPKLMDQQSWKPSTANRCARRNPDEY